MTTDTDTTVGAAVRELRKRFGWGQKDLADRSSLKHAQTVSEIENGRRSLKASEIVQLAGLFHVPAADLLMGRISRQSSFVLWREPDDSPARREVEARFVDRCKKYAFLEEITGGSGRPKPPSYALDFENARFEEAEEIAADIRNTLQLGDAAAKSLRESIESRWGIMVFQELMDDGSGATTRGEFGAAVLENAKEPPKRRAFSLAHELFHLLTWGDEPSPAGEGSKGAVSFREKMANSFAAALLMPAEVVKRKLDGIAIRQLSDLLPVAVELGVSTPALAWRSVNIHLLEKEQVEKVLESPDKDGIADRGWTPPEELDRPLPERYVSLAYATYMRGDISIGKLAELLETTVGMVEHRLDNYGLDLDADEFQAEVLPA